MTLRRAHLPLVALVLAAAGCQDPYSQPRRDTSAPKPAGPATNFSGGGPERTARSFASRWTNWDWRTAGAQQRALAALTHGQLAAQLRANASSARVDADLARDRPSARGEIVGVDLTGAGASRSGVVVTREHTYTAGHADLGGRHHRVYRIRLTMTAGRWEVSAWQRLP